MTREERFATLLAQLGTLPQSFPPRGLQNAPQQQHEVVASIYQPRDATSDVGLASLDRHLRNSQLGQDFDANAYFKDTQTQTDESSFKQNTPLLIQFTPVQTTSGQPSNNDSSGNLKADGVHTLPARRSKDRDGGGIKSDGDTAMEQIRAKIKENNDKILQLLTENHGLDAKLTQLESEYAKNDK